MIIGLCGAAKSGKDTVANLIEKLEGPVLRVQIAGPLKAYCRDLFGWTLEHTDGDLKDVPDERYSRPCKRCGHPDNPKPGFIDTARAYRGYSDPRWETCPLCDGDRATYLTPREAMQKLGGEFAEGTFPPIYAYRAARIASELEGTTAIITDCRYLRDIQAVKAVGGIIVVVHRDGSGLSDAAKNHPSETARQQPEFLALVDWDLHNHSTLDDLEGRVRTMLDAQPRAVTPLKVGVWINTKRYGEAVCIRVESDHCVIRYRGTHLASNRDIWTLSGEALANCTFSRPADDESRTICALKGSIAFGAQEETLVP